MRLYAQWKKCKYIVTCVDCYEDGSVIDSINNNKTMEVESGEMVSGENFGKDDALGAYYPSLQEVQKQIAEIVKFKSGDRDIYHIGAATFAVLVDSTKGRKSFMRR